MQTAFSFRACRRPVLSFAVALASALTLGLVASTRSFAQPGLIDSTFNSAITNPVVWSAQLQPDGHIVVHLGWPDYGLVRLTQSGSLDTNFNPGLPPATGAFGMALQADGKIVISGAFLEVQGMPRAGLARLNADGTLDGSFVPQIMPAHIPPPASNSPPLPFSPTSGVGNILVQPDGRVLATGFEYMLGTNNAALPTIVRFNYDGSIDTGFSAATVQAVPYQMALQPDGKILIATQLTNFFDSPATTVFRLNSDGSPDTTFATVNVSGWVNSFCFQGSNIVIGGDFLRLNGISSGDVARLNTNGQLDTSFSSSITGGSVGPVISLPTGKILADDGNNLVRLNTNGTLDSSYLATGGSYINPLTQQPDGKTLVGGQVSILDGVTVPSLVRLTGDTDTGPGTIVFDSAASEVFESAGSVTLTVDRVWGTQGDVTVNYQTVDGSAVAGSDYTAQSGVLVFHDGESSKTITVPLLDDLTIKDTLEFQVALSAAGGGAAIGAQSNCTVTILDVNGPSSIDPGFAVQPGTFDGAVSAVAVQPDGRLAVGGWFQQVASVPRSGVARLNADGSLDTSFDPGTGLSLTGLSLNTMPGWLNAVKLQADGKLLIAGPFNSFNGTNEFYLARLNTDGSLDTSFNDGTGAIGGLGSVVGDIRDVEVQPGGQIIAGGDFTSFNGVRRDGLVQLVTNGAVDTSFSPTVGGLVVPFGLQSDGKVAFGGEFNGYASRINPDGTTDASPLAVVNGVIRQVLSLTNGDTVIAGNFGSVGGQPRNCLVRLLPNGTPDPAFVPDLSLFTNVEWPPYIYAIAVQADGKLLAAIKNNHDYLARFNTDGTLDTYFEPVCFAIPSGDNEVISTIVVQSDNKILVGGQFQTVNGLAQSYLVRLKGGEPVGTRTLSVQLLSTSPSQTLLSLAVSPAKPFVLQTSSDLQTWSDLFTNTVLTSTFEVADDRIGSGRCFYRIKQLVP